MFEHEVRLAMSWAMLAAQSLSCKYTSHLHTTLTFPISTCRDKTCADGRSFKHEIALQARTFPSVRLFRSRFQLMLWVPNGTTTRDRVPLIPEKDIGSLLSLDEAPSRGFPYNGVIHLRNQPTVRQLNPSHWIPTRALGLWISR